MLLLSATLLAGADKPYDFRASVAYRQLSSTDRLRLEQVRRDQVLLWGALDMFADEHNGETPELEIERLAADQYRKNERNDVIIGLLNRRDANSARRRTPS